VLQIVSSVVREGERHFFGGRVDIVQVKGGCHAQYLYSPGQPEEVKCNSSHVSCGGVRRDLSSLGHKGNVEEKMDVNGLDPGFAGGGQASGVWQPVPMGGYHIVCGHWLARLVVVW